MRIGDIFVKFADFMKVYTAYVNNYNDAFKVFMDYTPLPAVYEARTSVSLQKFSESHLLGVAEVARAPRCKGLGADEFPHPPSAAPASLCPAPERSA